MASSENNISDEESTSSSVPPPPQDENGVPDCMKAFEEWKRCTSAAHQCKNYYVYGDVDKCAVQWADLKRCLSVKFNNRDTETMKVEWAAYVADREKETPRPSAVGVIWEPRTEKPVWPDPTPSPYTNSTQSDTSDQQ